MPTYKFIDLFAGLGGFHLALEQLGCKCVFASELQQDLRTLYESNFGMKCAGDINLINIEKDIPSHDILCGGFPCQPFSQAFRYISQISHQTLLRPQENCPLWFPEYLHVSNIV